MSAANRLLFPTQSLASASIGTVTKLSLAKAGTVSGPYGRDGGDPFDDSQIVDVHFPISKIVIRHGSVVDNIQVVYAAPSVSSVIPTGYPKHGGDGGDENTIVLAEGEVITGVDVRHGKVVDNLKFYTNMRTFIGYGGGGGDLTQVRAPEGYALSYISGRAGSKLDQITFHWVKEYPVKYTITKFSYNDAPVTTSPKSVDQMVLKNNTSAPQSLTWKREFTESVEERWSTDTELAIGVETEVKASVPGFGSASVGTNMEFKQNWSWGSIRKSETTSSVEMPIEVPAHTTLRGQLLISQDTKSLPYTATFVILYSTGRTETKEVTGIWNGVLTSGVNAKVSVQ